MTKESKSLKKLVIQTMCIKNELDKACFVHDAAYSDSKDLTKRTIANAYFKKWLRDNDIVMYSTHNEGKSVAAEIFIRT